MTDELFCKTFDTPWRESVRASLRASKAPASKKVKRPAAVLIPFCVVGEKPSVLFTLRSQKVGTHKGQVSFPGGMADPLDKDLIETALRETHEEVGISPEDVDILGTHREAQAITGVKVTPVVGVVDRIIVPEDLPYQREEIDAVFAVAIDDLLDPSQRSTQTYAMRTVTLPVFHAGPWPIWGLTAFLLDRLFCDLGAGPTASS